MTPVKGALRGLQIESKKSEKGGSKVEFPPTDRVKEPLPLLLHTMTMAAAERTSKLSYERTRMGGRRKIY